MPENTDFPNGRVSGNFTFFMQVTFTWEGKQHTGELKPVSGAGNVFHLMIRNYYQGQLVRTANGWQFSTQKNGYIPELAEEFGRKIDGKTT